MGKIKAYGYIRVSANGQVDKNGFNRQEKAIKSFAQKNSISLEAVFREKGVSGTKSETDRPALKEMMATILANGIKTVIVERLDRLAREYRVQEEILIYLARHNIELISADTGENITEAISDDPMKKAIIQIQGVFAELDKSITVKKLRIARQKVKAEKGKCEGAKRFGEGNNEEMVIVKKITYLRRLSRGRTKRMSYGKIAKKLNEEGLPTKRDKKWTPQGVYNIVNRKKS